MQISVRFDDRLLERKLREVARREGVSLNRAAVLLLRQGAGLEGVRGPESRIGRRLDRYFGTWTEEEAREFDEATRVFEEVDEDLWR